MESEKSKFCKDHKGESLCAGSTVSCSICLELVLDGERSIAKLQCGHEFHLDCIGSAFNAKGAMQCPNCRKVEKGQWLYGAGSRPFSEFNIDDLGNEDLYDLGYTDLQFGFQWCPFRGFTQIASLFEEVEPQTNAYHELLGASSFGDHSSSSSSTHVCPYLALHGFPHGLHPTSSTNTSDTMPESFLRRTPGMAPPTSGDMLTSHGFPMAEPLHHNWHQQTLSGNATNGSDQIMPAQVSSRLPRSDSSNQQRLGASFPQAPPFIHGSVSRMGSNIISMPVVGDARVHNRSHGAPVVGDARVHNRSHGAPIYQQPPSASTIRNPQFAPSRRTRHRGLTLVSTVGSSNSSTESGSFYGFSISGNLNRNHQEGENMGRRFHPWLAPLPWIPIDGESQWWSPFHPNQTPPTGNADTMSRNYFPPRSTQGVRQDSSYQHLSLPRMPPFR